MSRKTYSEAMSIASYKERFEYLKLDGRVGEKTFGNDRYVNQLFYRSPEWRKTKRNILLRDNGCDMACEGFDISGTIIIHHIEPITMEDILERRFKLIDPENLIAVSMLTHNAIHYGDARMLMSEPVIRTPNDTCPWKINDGRNYG